MSYDPNTTGRLLRTASGYTSSPHAPFIGELVAQLKAADEDITSMRGKVTQADDTISAVRRTAGEAREEARHAAEVNSTLRACADALEQIAKNPKGAKNIAKAALNLLKPGPAAAPPMGGPVPAPIAAGPLPPPPAPIDGLPGVGGFPTLAEMQRLSSAARPAKPV